MGSDGVAYWRGDCVGVEVAQGEWPEFHMAVVFVCWSAARVADGEDGEDLSRQAAQH
ncbi:hypothetical protein D3C83_204640 [compost metagenome]